MTRHQRYNRSDKGRARYARHEARRAADGRKAEKDARWYAAGGWYAQYRAALQRRIDQRTEGLA